VLAVKIVDYSHDLFYNSAMPGLPIFQKEKKFSLLFEQQADNLLKMGRELKDMMDIWQNVRERAGILAEMEQDGAAITHNILTLLHRAFIAPIEREDISAMANALDDIADRIHAVADRLYIYGVDAPPARAKEICDLILNAIQEVRGGVIEVNAPRIDQNALFQRNIAINQIEDTADKIYHTALAELFCHPQDDASLVKWREIYQKLKSIIDGCEAFGTVIEVIAIKHE